MAFILTTPAVSLTGIPGTILPDVSLPSGTPIMVDYVLWQFNITVKWVVTISDGMNNTLVSSYEILANHKQGTSPKFTRYATIGDKINHNIDVIISNDQLQLIIQNNEAVDLHTNVVRIQTNA